MTEPSITMEMSATLVNIIPAFIAAKANMGPLIKGANNPFFKSKYADLGSVIDVSEAALLEQGIATLQGVGGDGDHVSVSTLLAHTSGEWIKSTIVFGVTVQEVTVRDDDEGRITKTVKHDPQAAGSVVSYLRRYSLQAICNLAAEDDDAQSAKPAPAPPTPKTNVNAARRSQSAPPRDGIDPNAVLMRAVELEVIPKPDKIMFKEWARTKVPACKGLADNAPLTAEQLAACMAALDAVKPRLQAVPDATPSKDAEGRQKRALRTAILAHCRTLKLSDDDRHALEKHHHILGLRDEIIDQVPVALIEALRDDLTDRVTKANGAEDPDTALDQYAAERLL